MSLDRERRSFAEPAPAADRRRLAPPRSPIAGPVALAASAAWLVYAGTYALTFGLSGAPIAMAIRAGFANAVPDGLLAFAVHRISRAMDRGRSAPAPVPVLGAHLPWALALVAAAAAGKTLLLWLDVTVLHHQAFVFSPGVVAWQVFLSALIYVTVAATSHATLTARRLRDEEAHAARADALRARAEMAALRAQLNPHFLFNTLHSVIGLVRRDPSLAEAALEKLGDLLHYSIRVHRDGVDWIALRQEWEFVRTYLDLETIRLGDRLRIVRRVDEAALDQLVPTFSLQPLVENAVRHGIAPRAAGGQIAISAQQDHDTLRLEVVNDGDGKGTAADRDQGGLGLRVLGDRLEALYGGRARMTTGPAPPDRYRAVLILPRRDTDGEAGQ